MSLRINTNVESLTAQRNLSRNKQVESNQLQQLSSGSRINSAADDAAGLAISEKFKASIAGSRQAVRNAGDGVSMIQVAEGGLNEISSILNRLRELSVQAASDTVGVEERKFSNLEFQNLTQEVERIAQSTNFNGTKLISGDGGDLEFQVGILNSEQNDRIKYNAKETNATSTNLGIESLKVLTKNDAQNNLEKLDKAINLVSGNRATLGALQNRLQSTISNLEIKVENLSSANSRIRDTDVALASAKLAQSSILSAAGTSVLAQANAMPSQAMKLIG
jgi:flagellin